MNQDKHNRMFIPIPVNKGNARIAVVNDIMWELNTIDYPNFKDNDFGNHLGLIPTFFSLESDLKPVDQAESGYGYQLPTLEGTCTDKGVNASPHEEDPDLFYYACGHMKGVKIFVFHYGIVGFVYENGEVFITRMN